MRVAFTASPEPSLGSEPKQVDPASRGGAASKQMNHSRVAQLLHNQVGILGFHAAVADFQEERKHFPLDFARERDRACVPHESG